MKVILFVTGFVFNIMMMIAHMIEMSIAAGKLSVKLNKFLWSMDDLEICEGMENIDNPDYDWSQLK